MEYWKSWKYKNLTLLFISIVFAIWLSSVKEFHTFLLSLGNFGYIGAFLGGLLFVSAFTVATGAVILSILAEQLSILELALIGGLGGVVGDFIIFHYIKDNLVGELRLLCDGIGVRRVIRKIIHSRHFSWLIPVIGAVIIASPFPDEIGVSLMGIAKIRKRDFLIVTFILDTIAVFLVVSASRLI